MKDAGFMLAKSTRPEEALLPRHLPGGFGLEAAALSWRMNSIKPVRSLAGQQPRACTVDGARMTGRIHAREVGQKSSLPVIGVPSNVERAWRTNRCTMPCSAPYRTSFVAVIGYLETSVEGDLPGHELKATLNLGYPFRRFPAPRSHFVSKFTSV